MARPQLGLRGMASFVAARAPLFLREHPRRHAAQCGGGALSSTPNPNPIRRQELLALRSRTTDNGLANAYAWQKLDMHGIWPEALVSLCPMPEREES
eukprot:358933-Chlamydomonas_euryale.AAC.1